MIEFKRVHGANVASTKTNLVVYTYWVYGYEVETDNVLLTVTIYIIILGLGYVMTCETAEQAKNLLS